MTTSPGLSDRALGLGFGRFRVQPSRKKTMPLRMQRASYHLSVKSQSLLYIPKGLHQQPQTLTPHMGYSLNSLKEGCIGDDIGDYYGVIEGDTWSLDRSSKLCMLNPLPDSWPRGRDLAPEGTACIPGRLAQGRAAYCKGTIGCNPNPKP